MTTYPQTGIMIHRYPRLHPRKRRGLAPIEFIPFLPIFVIFLLVLMWIARVRLSEAQAGLLAEEHALASVAEHELAGNIPGEGNWDPLRAPELRALVHAFEPGLPLTSGGVREVARADSGEGVPMAVDALDPAVDFSERLVHSWEDQVFAFPQNSGQQPQLTLPAEVRGIVPQLGDLAAFKRLAEFSNAAGVGGGSALRSLGRDTRAAGDAIREGIESAEQAIATVSAQIDELRSLPFPDASQIAELEAERAQLVNQLDQLQDGQQTLQNASEILQSLTSDRASTED